MNFENIIVGLHTFYVFHSHVKFHLNWILFYCSINKFIFLCIILDHKNLKFKYLINDVAIFFIFLEILQT